MHISTYQLLKGVAKSTLPQTNYGKCALGLSASFYGYTFRKLPFEKALASTFFCSLITSFAIRFIEQKYHFSKKPPSPPLFGPSKSPQSKPKQEDISSIIENTPAIARDFTEVNSIEQIREHHEEAKSFLETYLPQVNAEVSFVSSDISAHIGVKEVTINKDHLGSNVFYWQNTDGVELDIQADASESGLAKDFIVMYGVASQFNGAEAQDRYTVKPSQACATYKYDRTQGPTAQLQFPNEQVELINCAANLGFNGFATTLSEDTKGAVQHGYLTPQSQAQLEKLLDQLRAQPNNLEFLCVKNTPKNAVYPIYQFLTAAPALGHYEYYGENLCKNDKQELQFLCALQSYRAQFETAISLAQESGGKSVIFKPTATGLGAFGNEPEIIAKAFYQAAIEHQHDMSKHRVTVCLQVFQSAGAAKKMADFLGLEEISFGS